MTPEQRERQKLLEKENNGKKRKKKKKGYLAGLGSIEDGKESHLEAAKQAGIHIAAGFAGGLTGTAIGRPGVLAGLVVIAASAYLGSSPLVTAGTGMLFGSLIKPTEAQQAQLNKEHPLKEGDTFDSKREQARASFALTTAFERMRDASYIFAKKDETKKDDKKDTGKQDGTGNNTPLANNSKPVSGLGWVTEVDKNPGVTYLF